MDAVVAHNPAETRHEGVRPVRSRIARVATSALGVTAACLIGSPAAGAAFTEISSFGTPGGGTGQLAGPSNLDVGPDGSVYVVDGNNQRIVKIGPGGAFERTWGKDVDTAGGTGFEICLTICKPGIDGGLAGEFESVEDVAVSPDGLAVYVTDDSNRRVAQFTPEGTFVRAWGRDVTPGGGTGFEICTSSCKLGIDGEEGGDLRRPEGIAVGPSGDVYVTESLNDRVSQFTATGLFVRAFGVNVDAAGGSGGFETCTADCQAATGGDTEGLSTTASGEVYAADSNEDAVLRFSAAGEHLGSFAADGSGPGAVTNPRSVDVGPTGEILLTQSTSTNGIYLFAADRSFVESFVPGPFATDESVDAAFGLDASAYVAQPDRGRVVRYAIGGLATPPVVPPPAPPAPAPAPPAAVPAPVPALPKAASVIVLPSAKSCVSRRNFRIRLKQPKGFTLRSATVSVNGKRAATRSGKRVTAPVDLRGLPKGRFTVKIVVTLSDGRKVTSTRRYRTCAPKRG